MQSRIHYALRFTSALLFVAFTPALATAMEVATGSFVGNGLLDGLAITGLGFAPEAVILMTNGPSAIATSTMADGSSKELGTAAFLVTSSVTLDADGFTVDSSFVNMAGVVTHWIAFGGVDDGFAVGTYVGDGTVLRAIDISDTSSSPDFAPDYVLVATEAGRIATMRYEDGGNALSSLFGFAGSIVFGDPITDLLGNGFEVSDTIDLTNENGVQIHYVAWREGPGVEVGRYAGNGGDASIPTALTPVYVGITRDDPAGLAKSMHRFVTQGADESYFYEGGLPESGSIKNFLPGAFTLGGSGHVNASGGNYFYIAFAVPEPGADLLAVFALATVAALKRR